MSTAVRRKVGLTGRDGAAAAEHAAVMAELQALHEAQDWTPERQERFRELCERERALRRRRKAAVATLPA